MSALVVVSEKLKNAAVAMINELIFPTKAAFPFFGYRHHFHLFFAENL